MLNLTILQDNVPEYINLLAFLNCLEKDNSDCVGTAHAILSYMILLDGSVFVISQVRHGMFPQYWVCGCYRLCLNIGVYIATKLMHYKISDFL